MWVFFSTLATGIREGWCLTKHVEPHRSFAPVPNQESLAFTSLACTQVLNFRVGLKTHWWPWAVFCFMLWSGCCLFNTFPVSILNSIIFEFLYFKLSHHFEIGNDSGKNVPMETYRDSTTKADFLTKPPSKVSIKTC